MMKKGFVLLILFLGIGIHTVTAQYWIPNFVEPEYVTISSTQGINVNTITVNHNGSYSVNIGNNNIVPLDMLQVIKPF